MKKEFYNGQPLVDTNTRERVTFVYDDSADELPCNVLRKVDGGIIEDYYEYEDLEPSREFKFPEIIAGLAQGYFEVGTEFTMLGSARTIKVEQRDSGLYLERFRAPLSLTAKDINSTWRLFEPRKEMTLEEIEAELGYKIKLT